MYTSFVEKIVERYQHNHKKIYPHTKKQDSRNIGVGKNNGKTKMNEEKCLERAVQFSPVNTT